METKDILELVSEYFKIEKELGMLLEGNSSFVKLCNKTTRRIHGKVDTLGAATHRCTHNSPNITQAPKTKEFRELLCVPEGKVLIDVDADALELVAMGHYLGKFDDYEFAKAVDGGSKENGTDIHTINQKRVGLPTRDSAKTFIYATIYGAGVTKLGDMVWDGKEFEYTKEEKSQAIESVEKRLVKLDGIDYFPIEKNTLTPYDKSIIIKTIYGNKISKAFRENTKGYLELLEWAKTSVVKNKIKGIDGRSLFLRSPHKALNLYLQSCGAIFMKYLLVIIDHNLTKRFTHGKEFAYVANIHDAINIECMPEHAEEICSILVKAFKYTSDFLGFKYPIKGAPKVGKNQYETH